MPTISHYTAVLLSELQSDITDNTLAPIFLSHVNFVMFQVINRHFGQSCDRAKSTANVQTNRI